MNILCKCLGHQYKLYSYNKELKGNPYFDEKGNLIQKEGIIKVSFFLCPRCGERIYG